MSNQSIRKSSSSAFSSLRSYALRALLVTAILVTQAITLSAASAQGRTDALVKLKAPATESDAQVKQSSFTIAGVERFSKHPSGKRPYYACPPPTKERASCQAVVVPPNAIKAVRQNRRALGLADQRGASVALEGSGVEGGFSPEDLRAAYNLSEAGGKGTTIAIVDAFGYPNAESDLATYRSHYGLPECTTKNGCFKKVNQEGEEGNYPSPPGFFDGQWELESALDMDMASAICPECHILLVEADGAFLDDLGAAENTAAKLGATVISNSWGAGEWPGQVEEDSLYFDHPGIPILFSSGDSGYGVSYPAASVNVVAVGGTTLSKDKSARGWRESAWAGSGSGCSFYEEKPEWQTDEGCEERTVADVAAVADPNTPVSVFAEGWEEEGSKSPGWLRFGGTSASAPIVAGIEARYSLAEREKGPKLFGEKGAEGKLFDVTEGHNGHCYLEPEYLCEAKVGYDGPTGWGTPATASRPSPPVVGTYDPVVLNPSEATLNGAVNPNGIETTYQFEYGTTTSYGTSVPTKAKSVGSGTEAVEVSAELASLSWGTTYHYRLVATNSKGTTYGGDRTFVPSRWSTQPMPSVSNTEEIEAVSCASATECIAVGNQFAELEEGWGVLIPLAQGWNGGKWEKLTAPPAHEIAAGYFSGFEDVSCGSPTSCMAVGKNLEEQEFVPLIERWDGTKWSILSPALPKDAASDSKGHVHVYLSGVSCLSSTECVAVGKYISGYDEKGNSEEKTLIETWDGSKWQVVSSPTPSEEPFALLDVSCTSTTSCMAVGGANGETLILRKSGSEWSIQSSPNEEGGANYLRSVSCTSSSSCMAVGEVEYSEKGKEPGALAESWNGSEWSLQVSGKPLQDISCLSASWCLGVGAGDGTEEASLKSVAERWNGSKWVAETPVLPDDATSEWTSLKGASCVPAGCTSVGYYLSSGLQLLAERLSLTAATTEAASSVKATEATLNGTINPKGADTTYQFQFGGTTSYGFKLPSPAKGIGSGTKDVVVSEKLSSLSPGTTYHFRVVAINANDTIYGEDQTFTTPMGSPTATTEAASLVKATETTLNGTVNPKGLSTTYQFEYGTTTSYGTKVPVSAKSAGSGSEGVKVSEALSGLKTNTTYHFRLTATNEGGTATGEDQTFTTLRVNPPTFSIAFGKEGTGNGQFTEPRGVAVDSKGNVWVVDATKPGGSLGGRVQKFNSKGEYLSQFGTSGTGNGQLRNPSGIAVDAEDNLYVVDTGNSRVQKFNSKGEYLSQFGKSYFFEVTGIAIDPQGNAWVLDSGEYGILKFNSKGEYLGKYGSEGSGNGQFNWPRDGIASDSDGNIWVADYGNNRIEKFSPKGEYLSQFGSKGSGNGQFGGPRGIAIDPKGNLWITASTQGRVQEILPEGEYLSQFGKEGTGEGQFKTPTYAASDAEGNLWVTDSANKRVQKWTQPAPQSVGTGAATAIKRTEATLNGTINPGGIATSYQFEYGTTTAYGAKAPVSPKSIGSGTTAVKVSEALNGLKAGTVYHYRVVATTEKGTVNGEDRYFTTLAPAGAGASWRIGGKTFAELGVKEESFATSGSFKIEIPALSTTLNCTESSNGTLSSTATAVVHMTLTCEMVGAKGCTLKPIKMDVDGKFASLNKNLTTIIGEGCPVFGEVILPNGSGSFEYGTEAAKLNVTAFHTTTSGTNTVYFTGSSYWSFSGANAGKAVGVW